MGTRADFYVGRGEQAEWLGSYPWDGYPQGIEPALLDATTEESFRAAVAEMLTDEDATRPEHGWPWPWNNSATTDYAYAFDDGKVWASCFGSSWFDPKTEPEDDELERKSAVFPDMSARKNATLGPRSGLIVMKSRKA